MREEKNNGIDCLKNLNKSLKNIKKSIDESRRTDNSIGRLERSLNRIRDAIEKPQKIDIGKPLSIELHNKPQKWTTLVKLLLILVSLLFVLTLAISALFIIPEEHEILQHYANPLRCDINYPTYLANGDEGFINLKLINVSNNEIKKVKLSLVFPPELPIIITSNGGSSLTAYKSLEAKETKTNEIHFYLKRAIFGKPLKFTVKIEAENVNGFGGEYRIKFFPILYIKTFAFWFFTALFSGIGVILLSIIIEKLSGIKFGSRSD